MPHKYICMERERGTICCRVCEDLRDCKSKVLCALKACPCVIQPDMLKSVRGSTSVLASTAKGRDVCTDSITCGSVPSGSSVLNGFNQVVPRGLVYFPLYMA